MKCLANFQNLSGEMSVYISAILHHCVLSCGNFSVVLQILDVCTVETFSCIVVDVVIELSYSEDDYCVS